MGKKAKALCMRVVLCLCCKWGKEGMESLPQPPVNQLGPNQSTVSHLDNSLNLQEKWGPEQPPRCNSKPDGKSASVTPTSCLPKTTIVTGSSVLKQFRVPTIPAVAVSRSMVEERVGLESRESSAGRYIPVSFSESSVHSYPCLPSSPSESKSPVFCDKNSDLSSQQDLALVEQNLQVAQFELNEEQQFPESSQDRFSQVVRGVNFRQLLQDSQDSDLPNIVVDRTPSEFAAASM